MSISTSPSLTNIAKLLAAPYLGDQSTNQNPPSSARLDQSTPSTKSPSRKSKSRSKYTHPCDACSLRKVKCDQLTPCSRCVKLSLPCTNKRQRKKSGAKLRRETREAIYRNAVESSTTSLATNQLTFTPTLPMEKVLACLQIYQTWYYGLWPVVSVAHLISQLVSATNSSSLTNLITVDNVPSYSLACALSAAIAIHVTFITTSNQLITLPPDLNTRSLVDEAARARNFYNYRLHPCPENLLTSFFFYVYYVNVKGCSSSALMYLREAISMAQVLGLHNQSIYRSKSPAEMHRLRKIYYLLLVTERFMSIEDDLPIILEPSIPYPSLEDEEYPSLLKGFTQLVRVFSIPDKRFFDRITSMKLGTDSSTINSAISISHNGWGSSNWIINVQQQLSYIKLTTEIPEVQKLNILLSKYWMKSLTWHIAKKNNLLVMDGRNTDESLQPTLPIIIAEQFLEDTKHLSIFAFELNGPGVCIKLIELAEGLIDSISMIGLKKEVQSSHIAFQYLNKINSLISILKNDITLPSAVYERIKDFVSSNSKVSSLQIAQTGYISEIEDGEESPEAKSKERKECHDSRGQVPSLRLEHQIELTKGSPFTQITKAFCFPSTQSPKNDINYDELLNSQSFDRLDAFRGQLNTTGFTVNQTPNTEAYEHGLNNHISGFPSSQTMENGNNQLPINPDHRELYEGEYIDSTSSGSSISLENVPTPFIWS